MGIRMQFPALIKSPYLPAVVHRPQFRGKAAEISRKVVHIPYEQTASAVITGGNDSLRQIDNDGAIAAGEHVIFGQIAMNDSGTEHSNDLPGQYMVIVSRLFRCQRQ